ncbi:stage III sporulation protein AF [Neobacillus thermocopriae]|uniref:Stage III sporulation protein AF n=1 Tax=Neobacillus thermocopriae TaxID=1215031 RepID=A0A6B3TQ43_9BACI|nr:stage III sporulation protein AF [Neobacillus thermocopriae]MED3624429.1 stage III sporulation protein AF [Neobacillus thermocopriae]MED3714820.1 stage III sporulation protein AF [Neobacillus thermocopriae]NEX78742.1 stage III sporulation protein AF [Neobacillus thermocopriae]
MDFLKEWVTNIILFILLATIIDMLLPNSSMQKYTKMVTGLLLIAIILSPIFKLISKDFESAISEIPSYQLSSENNMKNLIDNKKKEIQASQHAYILKEMAVQLRKDVEEELKDQYGLEITNIDISLKDENNTATIENLQKVTIQLKQPETGVKTVEAVKPIVINTDKPLPSTKTTEETEQVAAFLSKKWNVTDKIIEVSIEGGIDS